MDITWESIRVLLSRFKDGSVVLGILYFVSFLLLLPFWLSNSSFFPTSFSTKAVLLLVAITAFLLVHVLLNWTYYALVMLPSVVAIILFITGAAIWVGTPLLMSPLQAIFGLLSGGFGGGIADMVAGKAMGGVRGANSGSL